MDSPKTRFLKTPQAKTFADATAMPAFVSAIDAALLQMAQDMGTSQDMGTASACQLRMEGARRFVAVLMDLPNPASKPQPSRRDNLEP
jgi:hypothetical protein